MRRRNSRNTIPSYYILVVASIICIIMMFLSYSTGFGGGPFKTISNYIFMPMEKGVNFLGDTIFLSNDEAKNLKELEAENAQLKQEVDELTTQITNMELQQSELTTLQELYKLDSNYENYKTVGARIIAKDSSNWFSTFTIDKGSKDGIKKDMNVIAGSGLVGIVTSTTAHYSTVRAIIDDTSSVSATVISTSDNFIVSGSLTNMTDDNMIVFSNLHDEDDKVKAGDAVVTSAISDKYQPGILIGYITKVTDDSNDLTKSGKITPVVDFKHLTDVLIITSVKKTED